MNYPHAERSRFRRFAVFQTCLALAVSTASWAQVAAPPATPAPTAGTKPAAKKISVEKSDKPEAEVTSLESEAVILSPFEVTTEKDRGYRGGATMSGTRMGADLDDIANPMTVITKQQLNDFAMHDINDIFASELSVEGTRTFTANFNDGKADVDSVSLNPETANRVRGLGNANISIGNFGASSAIPIDTYNVDAVEISRGPNSSIFGMGEASGTVNLVPSAANLTRAFSKTSVSYSSFGTKRGTIDLSRPIFKNRLAIRVNALQEAKEYERKPSFDDTRRYQFSVTAQPFKYTTIRASYENFRERFSRPNSMTATDYVSIWKQVGSPSWNPSTNTWSYSAYTSPVFNPATNSYPTYPGGTGIINTANQTSGTNPNQYYLGVGAVAPSAPPPAGALWFAGLGSTRIRPVMYIDDSQVQWAGTNFWTNPTAPVTNNRHEVVTFALPVDYGVPNAYRGTLPYRGVVASSDKSFYDYDSINLSGLNRGGKDAEITRIELEQFVVSTPMHVVAFQFGFFKERIKETSRSFVGSGGDGVRLDVRPDVNVTYPDGTPNPHYGAPYMEALAPQTFTKPIDTKTYRLNAVYQLDLTKQKNFLRFLGTTKILGYAEDYEKIYSKSNLRYQDQIVDIYSPWYVNSIRNNNNGKFLTRYFVGDGNGGNIDHASTAPSGNTISYNRYGSVAATATTPAESPLGWYSINNATLRPEYFNGSKQNIQTTTQGFILQNYLLQGRVITTWGRRRDTLRTRDSGTGDINRSLPEPASAIDANTGLSTSLDWLDDFSGSPWNVVNKVTLARKSIGFTDNKGIVVKPFKWLNLRYNQSSSFKPEDFGTDFQGDPLPDTSGSSRDYGFSINMFKNRLNIGLTRFETFSINSRNGSINAVAQRITNLDYDTTLTGTSSNFDLEDWYYNELLASRGLTEAPGSLIYRLATPEERVTALTDTHAAIGLTDARIDYSRIYRPTATSDRRANGYELTVDYNPTKFLSIKFNGSRGETVYTNFGKSWADYRDERMPIWTTIKSPLSGARWWDQYTSGGSTPQQNWLGLNEAPMKVNLALDGKPVPQLAKYKFNFLARYRLAGIFKNTPFLKDTTIGGKLSWTDKTALGFYGAAPESDGLIREYDANRPIWYKAQTYVDVFATYDFRLFKGRIKGSAQLNVRNIGESGHLQPYAVNPDGKFYNYRIIDPREFILSVNFEL